MIRMKAVPKKGNITMQNRRRFMSYFRRELTVVTRPNKFDPDASYSNEWSKCSSSPPDIPGIGIRDAFNSSSLLSVSERTCLSEFSSNLRQRSYSSKTKKKHIYPRYMEDPMRSFMVKSYTFCSF